MKLRVVALIFLLAGSFAWTQDMENAGIDYTTALTKKAGAERIAAFETYIKNYPDPAQNVFTKLAYYWLTVDNYNSKNYDKAIRNGEKARSSGRSGSEAGSGCLPDAGQLIRCQVIFRLQPGKSIEMGRKSH